MQRTGPHRTALRRSNSGLLLHVAESTSDIRATHIIHHSCKPAELGEGYLSSAYLVFCRNRDRQVEWIFVCCFDGIGNSIKRSRKTQGLCRKRLEPGKDSDGFACIIYQGISIRENPVECGAAS